MTKALETQPLSPKALAALAVAARRRHPRAFRRAVGREEPDSPEEKGVTRRVRKLVDVCL